jgi:hypothetical protein
MLLMLEVRSGVTGAGGDTDADTCCGDCKKLFRGFEEVEEEATGIRSRIRGAVNTSELFPYNIESA